MKTRHYALLVILILITIVYSFMFEFIHKEKFNAYRDMLHAYSERPSQSLLSYASLPNGLRSWLLSGRLKTFVPKGSRQNENDIELCYINNDARIGFIDPLFSVAPCSNSHPIFQSNAMFGQVTQTNSQSKSETVSSGKCVVAIRKSNINAQTIQEFVNKLSMHDPVKELYAPGGRTTTIPTSSLPQNYAQKNGECGAQQR